MRTKLIKESQSMPDTLTIVTSTVSGSFSGFMLPSNGGYTVSELIVNGVDIASDVALFPEDSIIPCNVTKVTLTAGKIILFS